MIETGGRKAWWKRPNHICPERGITLLVIQLQLFGQRSRGGVSRGAGCSWCFVDDNDHPVWSWRQVAWDRYHQGAIRGDRGLGFYRAHE
jgi:hypothetical protein